MTALSNWGFKSRLQLANLFDWLGIYAATLKDWSQYDLKIERVKFEKAVEDPIPHRIQVSYNSHVAGRRIYGYGESGQEIFAYEKAICELIEREALFLHGDPLGLKSTNGLAAHRLTYLAKVSAKAELFERDAFLRHWLTKTPLKRVGSVMSHGKILILKTRLIFGTFIISCLLDLKAHLVFSRAKSQRLRFRIIS